MAETVNPQDVLARIDRGLTIGHVLYAVVFTVPIDGRKYKHVMFLSAPRDDRVMLKHFKRNAPSGKVVSYQIISPKDQAAFVEAVKGEQKDYQPLPAGGVTVTEAEMEGAEQKKLDLLKEFGLDDKGARKADGNDQPAV